MLIRSLRNWIGCAVSVALMLFLLSGCATTSHNSTSAADYLYSNREQPVVSGTPILKLPLRVGIAFVPGNSGFAPAQRPFYSLYSVGLSRGSAMTEKEKMDVMLRVAERFRKYPFVKDFQIIPTDYLTRAGGFENLDQIRAVNNLDVIVLVSYDQTQFNDQGAASLANLTIVGAYLVPGEKNETQTMIDAVVVDITSRRMLFRAPCSSQIKGVSTLVNQSQVLRKDSQLGYKEAADNMIENLDVQLATFRKSIAQPPEDYKVIKPAGYQSDLK